MRMVLRGSHIRSLTDGEKMERKELFELLKKVDSRYQLVNFVAKRARDIVDRGIDVDMVEKPVKIALDEIAENKIYLKRH